MIQGLFNKNLFIYIMIALCALGILLKLLLGILYSRLIKASDNMATSKNKLTQTMKKKFETCYKLKIGVNNVDIFVDKYVFRHKFCGILLSTWENICGQILMLCLLVGSISTILGLIYECGKQQVLSTFSVGILTSGMLIFLEGLTNLGGKKELFRLNMKDYLENILKVRLEQEQSQPDFIEQYKREYLQEEASQALTSSSLLAAASETTKKKSKKEISGKFEKVKLKRQQKEEKRLDKQLKKEQARNAAAKKVEDKRLAKELNRKEKQDAKLRVKEEAERQKREVKLALEKKREAERAEIERIRAEVRAEEELKKAEKKKQEEVKKALQLEKQAAKAVKRKVVATETTVDSITVGERLTVEERKTAAEHKPIAEYKTVAERKSVAQERKENLLREVLERRSLEGQEQEEARKEDNIAVTVVKEEEKVEMVSETKESAELPQQEEPAAEMYRPKKAPVKTFKPEKATVEKIQIAKRKPVTDTSESAELEKVEAEKAETVGKDSARNEKAERFAQKGKPVHKKGRQASVEDDKLIEDILKEFLA